MKPNFFLLSLVLALTWLPATAQEPEAAPDAPPAASGAEPSPSVRPAAAPAAKVSRTPEDVMRYAGIPLGIVKQMPALDALFALTPEQQAELRKAYEETVGEATKAAATNEDKRQGQANIQRARKAFESSRDSILSDQQHSLIRNVIAAFKAAQAKVKEPAVQPGTKRPNVQEAFYGELKPMLSQEEIDRLTAAGVKFP